MTVSMTGDAARSVEPELPGPGYRDHKADQLARLRKVEGQVRGIARMVEHDRYCIDVLTQGQRATRALQEVALALLDDHLRHCVVDATRAGGAQADEKLDELVVTLRRALRM
jgi:CsoR family transcriptional regulator, copper-sensing transcriptional repressor